MRPATPLSRVSGAVNRTISAWNATSSPTDRCPSTARSPPIHRISALLKVASAGATTDSTAVGTPSRCCSSSVVACCPAHLRKNPSSPPVAFIVSMSWSPVYAVVVSRALSARSFCVRVARRWITTRIATMLSSAIPTPTTVSCGSYVHSSSAYSTTTTPSTAAAARSRARVSATVSFDWSRCTRSAGERWAKKVTGSRSRWRRNRALLSVEEMIRPRSRLACWRAVSEAVSATSAPIAAKSGPSTEVRSPIRNRSMYVRLSAGSAAPTTTSSRLARSAVSRVAPVPRSRAGSAPSSPGLRPPLRNEGPGSRTRATPVNEASNSSALTTRRPLSGSLRRTAPRRPGRRRKPSWTT